MDIQFYHIQNEIDNQGTVAVKLPPIEELIECTRLGASPFIPIYYGRSYLHPNDRYEKKIGREVAQENITGKVFKLQSIVYDNMFRQLLTFQSADHQIRLVIRISDKSKRSHLISYTD